MAWHCQDYGGFVKETQEAHDNATMVMSILGGNLHWGMAAVCAALGNFDAESEYNPWRWQYDTRIPYGDSRIGVVCGRNTAHAYGIFQSDPAANYIYRGQNYSGYAPNYSDQPGSPSDGTAQMYYLDWVCSNYTDGSCGGWRENYGSSIPFATFKAQATPSTYTIAELTKIFHDGYERSATWSSSSTRRINAAQYWWDYFSQQPPVPPIPPTPRTRMPLWMMCRKKEIYIRKGNHKCQ